MRTVSLMAAMLLAAWLVAAFELAASLLGLGAVGPGFGAVAAGQVLGLAAGPALLVGGVAALIARAAVVRSTLAGLRGWLSPLLDRDPDAARGPVVRMHASALGLLVAIAAVVAAGLPVASHLWRWQDEVLARRLLVAFCAVAAVLAMVVARLLARWFAFALARLDRWVRLPWPASAPLRYLWWVLWPALLLAAPPWLGNRHELRWLAAVIASALTVVVAVGVCVCWHAWRPRARRARRLWPLAVVLVGVLGLGLTVSSYRRVGRAVEATTSGGVSARLLRALSDVDGDGASSLLGGGDCAPFDPSRAPARRDVPGNSIDEDCSGRDAARLPAGTARFFGAREAGLARRYQVLLVVIDGTRRDHTGLGGYRRRTTPYLDALGRQSWWFAGALAQSSATAFSFASLLTGLNPTSLRFEPAEGTPRLSASHRTLAERFEAHGYTTAMLTTRWFRRTYPPLLQGYQRVLSPRASPGASRDWAQHTAPQVVAQVISLVEHLPRPFFITAYFDGPHYPYAQHPEVGRFGAGDIDRYDAEIAYADRYLGLLIAYLRSSPALWSDTVLVVTSDHGEAFGEHGARHHAQNCHVESVAVPLLVRVPGQPPTVVRAPVALIDIAPTLLELVGAADRGEIEGHSLLLPAVAPQRLGADRPILCAVASQFEQPPFYRTAVRMGSLALLRDELSGTMQLYDSERDPGERHDSSERPAYRSARERLSARLTAARIGTLGRGR